MSKVSREEERVAFKLEQSLKYCREMVINEPSMFYKVGEDVTFGNIDKTTIVEVLDNGKIYKVKRFCLNGKGSQNPNGIFCDDYMYVPWHELEPKRDMEAEKIKIKLSYEDELFLSFSQREINGLLHYYYHSYGIDMNPDYQRGLVWTLEDKVNLIDSIFNNIDIGKFVLLGRAYREKEPNFEILDGKQRLTALVEFYENRYSYKGLKYYQLHWKDKLHFERYGISLAMTPFGQDIPQQQKYKYFLKLNKSGKPQDPEHIKYIQNLFDKI